MSSMVFVLNDVVSGFQFLVRNMLDLDGPIESFIYYMEIFLIVLVVLSVVVILLIPIYLNFYKLKNNTDNNEWTVTTMKGWLVVSGTLGLIFGFIYLSFMNVNLVINSFCYYSNEVLTNPNFYAEH